MWTTIFLLDSGLSYRIFMMIRVLFNECRQHFSWLNLARSFLGMSMSLGLEPAIRKGYKFRSLHHLMKSSFWPGQTQLLQNFCRIHLNHSSCMTLEKLLKLYGASSVSSSVEWVNFDIYLIGLLNKLTCIKHLDYQAHNKIY